MQFPNMSGNNFAKLKFTGFFSAAVILCVVIFSSFWGPVTNAGNTADETKMQEEKLNELQNDNKTKTDLIIKLQNDLNSVSAKNNNGQKLMQLENDSKAKTDLITKLQNQVNAASAKSLAMSANDQQLKQMQTDLQSKTDLISKLQAQLKSAPIKNISDGNDQKLRELQKDLQSKNATIAKLQNEVKSMPSKSVADAAPISKDGKKAADELEFLKWALRSEVSSNHALTATVSQLKQANAALTNQLKEK